MNDWIELKKDTNERVMVRACQIDGLSEYRGSQTLLTLDENSGLSTNLAIAEPYEQVKQKILDTEKMDNVVAERFTREEYVYLYGLLTSHIDTLKREGDTEASSKDSFQNYLLHKLEEILKEYK